MLRMILAVWLGLTSSLPAQTNGTVGILAERPTSGRAIETKQGWMVPYTQVIPGCDAAFEMVPIPAGEIELKIVGSNKRVTVAVEPLWVGKYEVTWAEYQQYMDECKNFRKIAKPNLLADATFVTAPTALYSPNEVYEFSPTKEHPACAMTQFAARQYTKWLSLQLKERYRLPTAAEWMYACSAGDLLQTINAKELAKFAVCESDQAGANTVGTRKANAWGLHDMLGNMSEWVIDGQGDGSKIRSPGKQSVFDAIEWTSTRYGHRALGGNWRSRFDECSVHAKEVCSIDWWELDPMLPISPWWMAGGPWVTIGFRIVRPLNQGTAEEWTRYWEPDTGELASDVDESIRGGRGIIGRPLVSPRLKKPIEMKNDTKR
ncbi:MAG: SUMF1/EgtB/PvdO family nonheme iron enzyme [Pirellulaceae bacterium]|nr:SUMF1/EgtB/PvdO family nonheme iron enzyme [Pirellulaceae bacterium]